MQYPHRARPFARSLSGFGEAAPGRIACRRRLSHDHLIVRRCVMQLKVPDAPNLSVRIIREVAHPLLESREIRQALGQVRLTQEDMYAVLSDHVGDLFCSPAGDDWSFTESIGWERMVPWI